MDPTDLEEFDQAHGRLAELQKTSQGAALMATLENVTKSTAQTVWTVAKPVLEVAGQVALEELKGFALGLMAQELDKLAGNSK